MVALPDPAMQLVDDSGLAYDLPATPEASPPNRWTSFDSAGRVDEKRNEQLELIKEGLSVMNSGDAHRLQSFIWAAAAPDLLTCVPQLNLAVWGPEGAFGFKTMFRSCIPDLCMHLEEIMPDITDCQRVCARAACNGTQKLPFIPSFPIGHSMTFSMVCYIEFGNGDSTPTKCTYFFVLPDPVLSLIGSFPKVLTTHQVATSTNIQSENNAIIASESTAEPLSASKKVKLSGDSFNKYMGQLEAENVDRSLLEWLVTNAWWLASTSEGSRLLQKTMDVADASEQLTLVNQFRGNVREAATSIHANHVLQKCIEVMSPIPLQFIIDELSGRVNEIAQTKCGCRVLERLLEHCLSAQVTGLVDEILIQPLNHCKHPFANFVIQHILEYGSKEHQKRLISTISKEVHRLARHRVANHVVRCALVHCDACDQEQLFAALSEDPKALADLQHHPSGSFVYREFKRSVNRESTRST